MIPAVRPSLGLGLALAVCVSLAGAEPAARSAGVVVERVAPGGGADRSGLKPGDVLLSWRAAAGNRSAGGALRDPLDLAAAEALEAPLGAIELVGRRGDELLEVTLHPGSWKVTARPHLPAVEWARIEVVLSPPQGQQLDDRLAALQRLIARAEARGADRLAAWLHLRGARELERGGHWVEAMRETTPVTTRTVCTVDPRARLLVHQRAAQLLGRHGQWEEAARVCRAALGTTLAASGDGLATATALFEYGTAIPLSVRRDGGEPVLRLALAMLAQRDPYGLGTAVSLTTTGYLHSLRADLDSAEALYRGALRILDSLGTEGTAVASCFNQLGVIAYRRCDLALTEQRYRQSLALFEKIEPDSRNVAKVLNNLGSVLIQRGDLATADTLLRRSLAVKERLQPASLSVANALNNLGAVAWRRQDRDAAESYLRGALELRQQLAPDGLDTGSSLKNLGAVAVEKGDAETAEQSYRHALDIEQRLAPGTIRVATTLTNLAALAQRQGDLEQAAELAARALEIKERLAKGGLSVANTLYLMAQIAEGSGDPDKAEALHRRALEIRQRHAPWSADTSVSLYEVGLMARARDRRGEADELLERSVSVLEQAQRKLGGTPETASLFRAQYLEQYYEYLDLLLEQGRADEAFHVLERSRARGLLALLAERDLVFASDIPAELDRERRITNARSDRLLDRLAACSDETPDVTRSDILDDIRQARIEQERIRARIREASPRLAALAYPVPLTLDATRAMLEPETLLLAFAVAKARTHIFAIDSSHDDLLADTLVIDRATLSNQVGQLRARLGQTATADSGAALSRMAIHLTDELLAPMAERIAAARRLIVLPDGPLHGLPFAALPSPADAGQHLLQSHPLVMAPSATVLGELLSRPRAARQMRVVAFGDPFYPGAGEHDHQLAGFNLRPLPLTRLEVDGIASLFAHHTTAWLGEEATEERAKAIGKGPAIVHFACHAVVDERFPLNSALALTIPVPRREGDDNGLLQAWEVFERVRLDADLVTLSACSTARGQEIAGEGIVGLTRAFHFAGARSVLASLWQVGDRSTAELMLRFYRHLRDGEAKDEALRAAQIELLRGPIEIVDDGETRTIDASAPYHWAAFQLIGDWR